jgi:adenylosuccinate lyase
VQDVRGWDYEFAKALDFKSTYGVCGQTYPRKLDVQVITTLADIAQSCHKFATDLRLLQHDGEMEEPFEEEQVGSSAMAYKRNPMRCERICGLARFVMGLVNDTYQTASHQWLERTLDDSSNRRLVIPQAFMALDGILRTYLNVLQGIKVNKDRVAANVQTYLPFMITEAVLMRAVKAGWDRQKAHEAIRKDSMAALEAVRAGRGQPLWHSLCRTFSREIVYGEKMNEADPRDFTGCAQEQVAAFAPEVGASGSHPVKA